jgi:hypothetical protein
MRDLSKSLLVNSYKLKIKNILNNKYNIETKIEMIEEQ